MKTEPIATNLVSPRLSGVIWGDAKTGKTTWAMSLPGRKLLINFDPDGFYSIAYREDVDVIDLSALPSHDAIEEAKKVADYIIQNAETYESVVLDSLTTLVEASLATAIFKKIGESNKFKPSIEAPGLAAYGARNGYTNDIVTRIMRACSKTGLNCFFIAHSDDPEFSEDGKNIVQHTMMLSSKIRNTTSLRVSEIYHLTLSSNGKRTVYFAPFGFKTPMGSRIIDTKAIPKIELDYTINKPDQEQALSLCSVINKWRENGLNKVTSLK